MSVLNDRVVSPMQCLRFLMEDELSAANHYDMLLQYLDDDEKEIVLGIIHDETVHFEQLRQLFIKRQKGYKTDIFDPAVSENRETLKKIKDI